MIYSYNKQVAMLVDGYTEIKLSQGMHLIILKKRIDDTFEYKAEKNIF
ncbi:MAG: hypothetical protein HRT40_11620 [Campylobacteraceae bacterium]|nr:hypothetical protein [Campylobacteraceae bacterium]